MAIYSTREGSADFATTAFMRKIYGWMTVGLALTGLTAWYVSHTPVIMNAIFSNRIIWFALVIIQFIAVISLSTAVQKMSPAIATCIFIVYSILTGLTLSAIFVTYTMASISNAFFTTTGMFLVMSIYGTVTKRNLSSWGTFLFMGLIGIIIAFIVNFFLKSSILDFIISCAGVIVFTGLTAYDTQKLRKLGAEINSQNKGDIRRGVIIGALTLYLDFINLFIMLLRIFNGGRK